MTKHINIRRILLIVPYRIACIVMAVMIKTMSSDEQAYAFLDEWWS